MDPPSTSRSDGGGGDGGGGGSSGGSSSSSRKSAAPPPLVLYAPPLDDSSITPFPYPVYEEEGLIRWVGGSHDYGLVEPTESCACSARDGMAVRGLLNFVCRSPSSPVGHTAFRLPTHDPRSVEPALAWLLCHHFKFLTFRTRIEGGTLVRGLTDALDRLFEKRDCSRCTGSTTCVEYRMRKQVTPVFFLRHVVLSDSRAGPTMESVLLEE